MSVATLRTAWVGALSLVAIGAACRSAPETAPVDDPGKAADAAASASWRGVALFHDSHCGGAALTQGQLARLRRPARNRTYAVLPGNRNSTAEPVARFTTGADGAFELAPLPPAAYCVVEETRRLSPEEEARLLAEAPAASPSDAGSRPGQAVDPECMRKLPLRCDTSWRADLPGFRPDLSLAGSRCPWNQPCSTYLGPMPP